jgi:large subunit ribosomal protein L19
MTSCYNLPSRLKKYQRNALLALFGRNVSMEDLLKSVEAPANPNIPELHTGDTVSVHVKIKEGNRERIQEFKGTILYKHNNGNNSTFTVRRVATNGIGVERTFLLRSPRIDKVVVERSNKVKRARLYFLRKRTGKSARLKQKFN